MSLSDSNGVRSFNKFAYVFLWFRDEKCFMKNVMKRIENWKSR